MQKLDETRRATGILVRHVATEPEADPPRACIDFTVAPARRDDFHAEDWVRLDPAVPGAAVTREGDQICVSGLPSGATTRITLRAGMPGEAGLSLVKDTSLNIAMANRRPRIDFDTRMFLLPRGQTPAIGLSTVNLSSVSLTLARLTERNVIALRAQCEAGPAGRDLGRRQDRRTERPRSSGRAPPTSRNGSRTAARIPRCRCPMRSPPRVPASTR